jgi:DNA-binding NarL/FixJ family response regulator
VKGIYRIVVVDSPRIAREGLAALVALDPEIEIAGFARDGREAVAAVAKYKADVVLISLDVVGIGGLDTVRDIKKRYPRTKFVALTTQKSQRHILDVLGAGVNGYILRNASGTELVSAIKTAFASKTYLSPEIGETVISGFVNGRDWNHDSRACDVLTRRELQILKLIAVGRTNRLVAEQLCISVKTVERHRANLMAKLDLHNGCALTRYAVSHGLIDDEETLPSTIKRFPGLSAVRMSVLAPLPFMDWAANWMAVAGV